MGVYVPNWNKPISCYRCQFVDVYLGGSVGCQLTPPNDKSCPLIEVPVPHGRLIDAEAYENYLDEMWITANIDAIYAMPTVIEREEE